MKRAFEELADWWKQRDWWDKVLYALLIVLGVAWLVVLTLGVSGLW